ncbi:MAG: hypothetical protein RR356_00465 [Bacteroidales bacterium]
MHYKAFSGGMMLHTGYVFGGKSTVYDAHHNFIGSKEMKGTPWGIGGVLRFHFGKHLRIGTEGYSTNLQYGKNGSFVQLGWGGFLMDCQWIIEKFTLFVGGTLGGGGVKNLTLLDNSHTDFVEEGHATYRKYGVGLLTPFMGFEYAVTPKLHLIVKLDYIMNITNPQPDFVTGPRIYFGVLFCRERKSL